MREREREREIQEGRGEHVVSFRVMSHSVHTIHTF